MQPKVMIVVVNYNSENITLECLNSVFKIDYQNYFVVLVDNGSSNNLAKIIKTKFPNIILIENKKNIGFAPAINQVIKNFKDYDYLLLLNNDTIVDKNFLSLLIQIKDAGILGGTIYYYNSDKIWFAGGKIRWLRGLCSHLKNINYKKKVDFITGCCFLLKKEVINCIGNLDERLVYAEDVDWCIRAKNKGYKIIFVPDSKIWHRISQTFGKKTPNYYYYLTRSRMLFFKKHTTKIGWLIFLFVFFLYDCQKEIIKLFLFAKFENIKAIILAIKDFYKNKFDFINKEIK